MTKHRQRKLSSGDTWLCIVFVNSPSVSSSRDGLQCPVGLREFSRVPYIRNDGKARTKADSEVSCFCFAKLNKHGESK